MSQPPRDRMPGVNRRTVMVPAQRRAVSFEGVWRRAFRALDHIYRSCPGDGVLVAAIWGDRVQGYRHIPVRDEPAFALVGRHTACDLALPSDSSISLRHLLVGVRRRRSEVRLRLLDLATGVGMATEDGMPCEALATDGAAFLAVGEYQLFLLPTGSLAPLPWGSSADDAWAAIPDRVYLDRRAATRQGQPAPVSLLPAPPATSGSRRSISTLILDPPTSLRQPVAGPGDRGARAGEVEISTLEGSERYQVHDVDLERGLLVGRYERCTLGAADARLSRVHLALLRDGDDLFAVDTASSNGTTAAGNRFRQLRLGPNSDLCLAHHIRIRWRGGDQPPPVGLAGSTPAPGERGPTGGEGPQRGAPPLPTPAPVADALLAALAAPVDRPARPDG